MIWIIVCTPENTEWRNITFSRIHRQREISAKDMGLSLRFDRICIQMVYIEAEMQERSIKILEEDARNITWNIMEQKNSSGKNFIM